MKISFVILLASLISMNALAAAEPEVLVTCQIKDTSDQVAISLDETGTYTITSGLFAAFNFNPTNDFYLSANEKKRVDIQVVQNSGQSLIGVTLQLNEDSSVKSTGVLWSKDYSMMRPRNSSFDLVNCTGTFKSPN